MSKIDGLIHYIKEVEKSLNAHIIIKDFIGFLDGYSESLEPLQQFYIHQSKYCMMIKGHHHLWNQCLYGIDLMSNKLKKTKKAYYGFCHAGVGEYIVPIMVTQKGESQVIGAVTLGGFYSREWSKKRDGLEEVYRIKSSELDKNYEISFHENVYDLTMIEEKLAVVAEYIGLLCQDQIFQDHGKQKNQFDQNYIIGHAMAYIKNHFKENIQLKEVADFCHCSPSYISHNFKKVTGKTLKAYVNHLRLESGKYLLECSDMSITEIAYAVGFKDSNYFSKVFSDTFTYSPMTYRKGASHDFIQ